MIQVRINSDKKPKVVSILYYLHLIMCEMAQSTVEHLDTKNFVDAKLTKL